MGPDGEMPDAQTIGAADPPPRSAVSAASRSLQTAARTSGGSAGDVFEAGFTIREPSLRYRSWPMEQPLITAVTHSTEEARLTLKDVPHTPGIAGRIATVLADSAVNIDMIIQNEPITAGERADISVTIPRSQLDVAREALAPLERELGLHASSDEVMGKVSVIGAGMKSHPSVAAKVFTVLGDEGVNIEMIATSPIKISCVIAGDRVPGAVRALHSAFELAGPDTIRPERPFGEFA